MFDQQKENELIERVILDFVNGQKEAAYRRIIWGAGRKPALLAARSIGVVMQLIAEDLHTDAQHFERYINAKAGNA